MLCTFWIFKCHRNHGGLKGVKFCTFLTSFVLQPLNHCVTWSLSQFISKEKCALRLVGKSPLCDNYTCLVFIILSGCVVALTTFIAHSSWYITVRQNILKYRCMQWEIGILLRIFAGFTTTKKHLRNQSSNVVTFPDIICDNQCY